MIRTIGPWAQAPDLIEPLAGYRAWRFTRTDAWAHLFSVSVPPADIWEGAWRRWVVSRCRPVHGTSDHPAPWEACRCGFYAVKSPFDGEVLSELVWAQVRGESTDRSGLVLGRVLLAGKVIEHEIGYRAERARIAELLPTTTDRGATSTLARQLGIPLGRPVDTTTMFDAFGAELAAKLEQAGPYVQRILRHLMEKRAAPDALGDRAANGRVP